MTVGRSPPSRGWEAPTIFTQPLGGRLLCLPIFSAFVAVQILGGSGGTVVHNHRICSAGKEAVDATSTSTKSALVTWKAWLSVTINKLN